MEKKLVKFNAFAGKEEQSIPLNQQKEMFDKFVVERTGEIEKLYKNYIIILKFGISF